MSVDGLGRKIRDLRSKNKIAPGNNSGKPVCGFSGFEKLCPGIDRCDDKICFSPVKGSFDQSGVHSLDLVLQCAHCQSWRAGRAFDSVTPFGAGGAGSQDHKYGQ